MLVRLEVDMNFQPKVYDTIYVGVAYLFKLKERVEASM
jgi:hypothetical protein